jgi:putative NIF3 family GTP cyclohydrolase 1 type 2
MKVSEILERIKKATGAEAAGIIGDDKKTVKKAAVCAGSCGDIIDSVIKAGCDLYVTGELKHHSALSARQAGLTCICLTHTVSERFILKKIAKNLRGKTEGISFKVSTKDKDPFEWKQL